MVPCDPSLPDWRDAAAYAPLLAADRAILAWEWQRRARAYRSAALAALEAGETGSASEWGLHRWLDPRLAAPDARPLWTSQAYDAVLAAEARPCPSTAGVDISRCAGLATIVRTPEAERILLSDGSRVIRMDLLTGSAEASFVGLTLAIPGPPALRAQLPALRRLDALLREGRFVRSLHPPEPYIRRQVLVLRAADGLAAGVGQRQLAAVLLDRDAARTGWREERPDLRLRAQRLARDARTNLAGGYRALLRRAPAGGVSLYEGSLAAPGDCEPAAPRGGHPSRQPTGQGDTPWP